MISVSLLLSIAAIFWSTHGGAYVPPDTVAWGWSTPETNVYGPNVAGYAYPNKIYLSRVWWDKMRRADKCSLVVHEYGHAALSLLHVPGTIMDAGNFYQYMPGLCKQFLPRG